MRFHSCSADASDFFLIDKETACSRFYLRNIEHCDSRRISAASVIVAVSEYHAAVESCLSRLACRHSLDLSREEINEWRRKLKQKKAEPTRGGRLSGQGMKLLYIQDHRRKGFFNGFADLFRKIDF
jgi:hypothetical protein